jgi:hypothetical protein
MSRRDVLPLTSAVAVGRLIYVESFEVFGHWSLLKLPMLQPDQVTHPLMPTQGVGFRQIDG